MAQMPYCKVDAMEPGLVVCWGHGLCHSTLPQKVCYRRARYPMCGLGRLQGLEFRM